MPGRRIYAAVFALSISLAFGQSDPVRKYNLLREDDDWTFLRDPTLREDIWDPIKYIPLRQGAADWNLSLGGEVRQSFEAVGNDNWGQQPFNNAFWLQRYIAHADVRYGKYFRSFVQLKSGVELFRQGGPRPIDKKDLDFQAAFIEVGPHDAPRGFVFRIGRQELNYGSGRLLSVREGPNVRQSFDGVKIRSKLGQWNIDAFAVRPTLDKPGFFDNVPDHRTGFWGAYATRPEAKGVFFDAYYFGIDHKGSTYNRGSAREVRHSLGTRLWRRPATKSSGWDFDYEGVWQFGSFGSANIRAWTLASDTAYRLPSTPLAPRFSLKADISSGDDPKTRTLGTFSALYPIGNYFGVLADTGPGPQNFIDIHPRVQSQILHSISVSTDVVVHWRENLHDGVYAVPGFLLRPAGINTARFVGYRPGVEARWQIDRHAFLQADYGVFFAGRFLQESMPGRNLNYWTLWAGYKF